jgi:hypothetical protein
MNGGLHPEVLLAIGYAAFLGGVAAILELLARHTHRRAERYRIVGFKYHRYLDVWECPTGQHLHRHKVPPEHRIVRYRAPAHVCNACGLKHRCTTSDEGREIAQSTLLWLETEVGRFHRGLSLALLLLAQFILGLELWRFPSERERLVLLCALAPLTLTWAKMLTRFRTKAAPAAAP